MDTINGVTRLQSTLLLFSLLAGFGCDTFELDALLDGEGPVAGAQAEPGEFVPHPYTSCDSSFGAGEGPYHEACGLGCGLIDPAEGPGYMLCGIPCEADLECMPWTSDGSPLTSCLDGRCYYHCNEDHACPSDLECIYESGGAWGECYAMQPPPPPPPLPPGPVEPPPAPPEPGPR